MKVENPYGRNAYQRNLSVPRTVSAQLNNIGYTKILSPLRKQLLEELWSVMANKNPQHFFTVYLTVFMMLHEIAVITRDRRRWAVDNNIKVCSGRLFHLIPLCVRHKTDCAPSGTLFATAKGGGPP